MSLTFVPGIPGLPSRPVSPSRPLSADDKENDEKILTTTQAGYREVNLNNKNGLPQHVTWC